jgi:hypothetical protein
MAEEIRYDVFLSHNSQDKPAVEILARRLTDEASLRPFLDKWHLVPGEPWQEALEEALDIAYLCRLYRATRHQPLGARGNASGHRAARRRPGLPRHPCAPARG